MTAVVGADGKVLVAASTDLLLDQLDPFNCTPWDGMPAFTVADVAAKVDVGDLHPHRIVNSHDEPPDVHLARIAWLVLHWANDGSDPPQVEVGGRYGLSVHDGYHRICAAVVRGDERVWLDVGGDLGEAEELFGVVIP